MKPFFLIPLNYVLIVSLILKIHDYLITMQLIKQEKYWVKELFISKCRLFFINT